MSSVILVHPDFENGWSFAADHFHSLWAAQGPVRFERLTHDDRRSASEILGADATSVTRLVLLSVPFGPACEAAFVGLCEAHLGGKTTQETREVLTARGVRLYSHTSEGFWGESVSEFGLALTLCGLRRIPQLHHRILTDLTPWDYNPAGGLPLPGTRCHQFGDNPAFTSGTIAGKRVRIVGAGNIASRYASFCQFMGADVAAWDPFATEPCFHRAGSRRERHLDRLVTDAEIFAPMVPLTEKTTGIVTAAHIDALPKGCLVVLVTRANICDMGAVRRRVLAGELSLAADVFDIEPLPLDDPLLGRDNVVHTPHNAGRTIHANEQYANLLAEQFLP
ncbi:NAD(P)-dependent oxidoreductase [Armatimonas sp.]|uniref:NAD(P)-dependent oxidoreductase n=1 Tax=Armatimonas sp. TaxID=1872638 RepID=UPI003752A619